MKTILTILLTIITYSMQSGTLDNTVNSEYYDYIYAFNYINKYTKSKVRSQYIAKYFIRYTKQYNLIPYRRILLRQSRNESRFKKNALGDNGQSYGINQIKLKYVRAMMWKLDNGKLGKHFKRIEASGKKINYAKYIMKAKHNEELRCMRMSELLQRYKRIDVSLLGYGCGTSSDTFKKLKNNKYIDFWYPRGILDEKDDYKIIKKYNGYNGKA